MKKSTFLLAFLLLPLLSATAQELVGRKIITGFLNFDRTGTPNATVINYGVSLKYGKIRENLTYTAYGLGVVGNSAANVPNSPQLFSIGPEIELGKFSKIAEKLYLAPYVNGTVRYTKSYDLGSTSAAISGTPFRVVYLLTENLFITGQFGEAKLYLRSHKGASSFGLNANMTNAGALGIFYAFK